MTTLHAHSQVNPGFSGDETLFASRRAGVDVANVVDVEAIHGSAASCG
jgi:hypothetical protein